MLKYASEHLAPSWPRSREWEKPSALLKEREFPRKYPVGLMVAGLLAVGIGALAWYYLAPDVRRYMKIRSM